MIRLTPVWTRQHTLVLIALAPAVFGTAAAAGDPPWLACAVGVLFVLTLAGGLSFDVFLASAAGVLAAAATIGLKQLAGIWNPEAFGSITFQVLCFPLTGWLASLAGAPLRNLAGGRPATDSGELFKLAGPLGLISPAAGELRLEEEVERAELHGRPLSLLRVRTEILENVTVTEQERVSIYRAVARLVESMLRPTDIPFAYEDNSVVAILPEMLFEYSWQLVAPLVDAIGHATFVVRPEGKRHYARDYAEIQLSVVSYPDHGRTADELLEASLDALPNSLAGRAPESRGAEGKPEK